MANLHVLINLTSFLSSYDDENCMSSSLTYPFHSRSYLVAYQFIVLLSFPSLLSRSVLNPLSFLDVITQTINLNYIFLLSLSYEDKIENDETFGVQSSCYCKTFKLAVL